MKKFMIIFSLILSAFTFNACNEPDEDILLDDAVIGDVVLSYKINDTIYQYHENANEVYESVFTGLTGAYDSPTFSGVNITTGESLLFSIANTTGIGTYDMTDNTFFAQCHITFHNKDYYVNSVGFSPQGSGTIVYTELQLSATEIIQKGTFSCQAFATDGAMIEITEGIFDL